MPPSSLETFRRRFGGPPAVLASAPGRVNLIGEHVDYCGGPVLPLAIDRRVHVAAAPAGTTVVHSTLTGDDVPIAREVLAKLDAPPLAIAIDSDLPAGAGLSSSAALAVAVATAAAAITGVTLDPLAAARLCRDAEHDATGVPCGLMDPLASIAGRAGHVLLIDCAVGSITPIRWPDPEYALLVVDSGVRRALADGRYAATRQAVEAGVASGVSSPALRHVRSEITRVRAAAEALAGGCWENLGSILDAGHASLRDDLNVSCPEIETLVARLARSGVLGCRMTGGGFGGCVIALVRRADGPAIAAAAGAGPGTWILAIPADGAAAGAVP